MGKGDCSSWRRSFKFNVRSPVDLGVLAFADDLLDHVEVKHFGQILLDQSDPLFGGHLRHVGRCW